VKIVVDPTELRQLAALLEAVRTDYARLGHGLLTHVPDMPPVTAVRVRYSLQNVERALRRLSDDSFEESRDLYQRAMAAEVQSLVRNWLLLFNRRPRGRTSSTAAKASDPLATKLANFRSEHEGKFVIYDKAYGAQCVGLVKQYLKEVHGITPSGSWGDASDWWTAPHRVLVANFERVEGSPQAGDIVVLKGHIGIMLNATQMLEQNGGSYWQVTTEQDDAVRVDPEPVDPKKVLGYWRRKSAADN